MESKNYMKSELHHMRHPRNMVVFWIGLYTLLAIIAVFAVHKITERVRLHTIPSGSVELTIPYSKYVVGEVVSFSVKNSFNSPIYVSNNCPEEPLTVYRKIDVQWVRIHDQTTTDKCPSQARQIEVPANGVVNGSFEPWQNLFHEPGRYRVVLFVEYYNTLPYQEFEIIAQPEIAQPQSGSTTSVPGATSSQLKPITPAPQTEQNVTPQVRTKESVTTPGGTISVEYDQAVIYVTSIAPANGCRYEGGKSGSKVEVDFKCEEKEFEVRLGLVDGSLVQSVETEDND